MLRPAADPYEPFQLFSDANAVSVYSRIACAVYDEHAEKHYIIARASRNPLPRLKIFSTIECEVYAIVCSVSKFAQWIYSREAHV